MPHSKGIFYQYSHSTLECQICGYVSKGKRAKRLHAKYSHGKELPTEDDTVSRRCRYCKKSIKHCSCF